MSNIELAASSDSESEQNEKLGENQDSTKMSLIGKILDYGSSTQVGQFVLKTLHKGFSIVEDTAIWSCPHQKSLVRPLPWIFFLPAIITVRLIRTFISIASLMLGMGPMDQPTFVRNLQRCRRKVRAIRYSGMRAIRLRNEASAMDSGRKQPRFLMIFSIVFGQTIVRCVRPQTNDEPQAIEESYHQPSPSSNRKSIQQEDNDDKDSDADYKNLLSKTFTESEADTTYELDASECQKSVDLTTSAELDHSVEEIYTKECPKSQQKTNDEPSSDIKTHPVDNSTSSEMENNSENVTDGPRFAEENHENEYDPQSTSFAPAEDFYSPNVTATSSYSSLDQLVTPSKGYSSSDSMELTIPSITIDYCSEKGNESPE